MRISDQSADNTDHKVGHTTEADGFDLRELGSDSVITKCDGGASQNTYCDWLKQSESACSIDDKCYKTLLL